MPQLHGGAGRPAPVVIRRLFACTSHAWPASLCDAAQVTCAPSPCRDAALYTFSQSARVWTVCSDLELAITESARGKRPGIEGGPDPLCPRSPASAIPSTAWPGPPPKPRVAQVASHPIASLKKARCLSPYVDSHRPARREAAPEGEDGWHGELYICARRFLSCC